MQTQRLNRKKRLILNALGVRQDQSVPPDIAMRIKAGEPTTNDLLWVTKHILEKEYGDYKYQSNVFLGKDFLNFEEWKRSVDLKEIIYKYL